MCCCLSSCWGWHPPPTRPATSCATCLARPGGRPRAPRLQARRRMPVRIATAATAAMVTCPPTRCTLRGRTCCSSCCAPASMGLMAGATTSTCWRCSPCCRRCGGRPASWRAAGRATAPVAVVEAAGRLPAWQPPSCAAAVRGTRWLPPAARTTENGCSRWRWRTPLMTLTCGARAPSPRRTLRTWCTLRCWWTAWWRLRAPLPRQTCLHPLRRLPAPCRHQRRAARQRQMAARQAAACRSWRCRPPHPLAAGRAP